MDISHVSSPRTKVQFRTSCTLMTSIAKKRIKVTYSRLGLDLNGQKRLNIHAILTALSGEQAFRSFSTLRFRGHLEP